MEETPKKVGWNIILLALLLIGFPSIGWIYMKKAAKFRTEAIEQMGDYGKFKWNDIKSVQQKPFTIDSVTNRVVMTVVFDTADSLQTGLVLSQIDRISRQFGQNPNSLIMVLPYSNLDAVQLDFGNWPIEEWRRRRCYTFELNNNGIDPIDFNFNPSEELKSYWVLSDKYGIIRNYYDVKKEEDIKEMVVHAGICIPDFKKR